jgi:hypothetical protein
MGPTKTALFLDIPSLIDSAWRRLEYLLNAECRYQPGPPPGQPHPLAAADTRRFWTKPPFWFFAITLFFCELRADLGRPLRHRAASGHRRPQSNPCGRNH